VPASYICIKEMTRLIQSYEDDSPSNSTFPLIAVSILTSVALIICDLCNVTVRISGGEGPKGRIIRE
jgi:hypothetical protein